MELVFILCSSISYRDDKASTNTMPSWIRIISSYKIDIEDAIKILNKKDCGDTFVDVELSWPLVPDCNEPYWHFRMTLGNEVFIGANSGTSGCHKFKELLNNTQKWK